MEKVTKAILRYLFKEYLKAPSVLYAINEVAALHKVDPVEISNYMVEKNWIREQWVHYNNLVTCRITVVGIEEINPSFIHSKLSDLIDALIEGGGRKSLAEIFQHKIEEYAIALDIVYQLEKLKLVTIIHQEGSIYIALTPSGWKFSERDRPFLTLMAVA
jgi:hypothetical protein